jgi:hypothetical protein
MQTLHLRFRDLRAISPGQSPSRWQTPSAAKRDGMGGAFALPNPPEPTLAVGSPSVRRRNSPPESLQEAASPSHQRFARCPSAGAGLPLASPFRELRVAGPDGAATKPVCRWQTARNRPHPAAPHEAGQGVVCSLQARASESRWLTSDGLSFPLRPQPSGGRASGEKTADRTANIGALAGVSSGARRRRSSSAGG